MSAHIYNFVFMQEHGTGRQSERKGESMNIMLTAWFKYNAQM